MSTQINIPDYSLRAEQVPLFRPEVLSASDKHALKQEIAASLKDLGAVLVAHYYVDGDVQDLAEETGGCVADSLEMARFGHDHPAQTLIVAGVRFMGESSKILSPHKRVFMPTLEAQCSLDLGCPPDEFEAFCDKHLPHLDDKRAGEPQRLERRGHRHALGEPQGAVIRTRPVIANVKGRSNGIEGKAV